MIHYSELLPQFTVDKLHLPFEDCPIWYLLMMPLLLWRSLRWLIFLPILFIHGYVNLPVPPMSYRSLKFDPKVDSCVLVCVGIPGCGKTQFSDYLATTSNKWSVFKRSIRSTKSSIYDALQILNQGKSLIIDLCNHTPSKRRQWIQLADRHASGRKLHQLDGKLHNLCLVLPNAINVEASLKRLESTENVNWETVCKQMVFEYEPPNINEGYDHVQVCESMTDLRDYILWLKEVVTDDVS